MWRYLTPVIAVAMVYFSAPSIGPAWRAHEGRGTRGMVTVTDKSCSRSGCDYSGDFVSDDGTVDRPGVGLASGFSNIAVGVRVIAYDTGDPSNVFPPGGGEDWLLVPLIVAGAIGALLIWIYVVVLSALRRRPNTSKAGTAVASVGADGRHRSDGATRSEPESAGRFTVVRWREGYNIDEVDAFLTRVDMGTVTSSDVRHVRFTPVRLRPGYEMRAVDQYLDLLAAQLTAGGR